jgi:hypothetical protein
MEEGNIILQFIQKRHSVTSPEVAALLGVSRQRAHTILSGMLHRGEIIKTGKTRTARYLVSLDGLPSRGELDLSLTNQGLKEHEVLQHIRDKFLPLKLAPDNVRSIFDYAFSEMLNNAIEHSRSKKIDIRVSVRGGSTGEPGLMLFTVRDFGIGVFKNVMESRQLSSELEAMQDLLKGKTTTAPQAHSGEGIFFSSKAADRFILRSFEWELRVDNLIPDVFFTRLRKPIEGTEVEFSLEYRSARHLLDVFKVYMADPESQDFDRTEILVRLFTHGTVHVSRSQARRILTGLEKFKRITLDFDRVPTVGQAFADEIFRVFRTQHPDVRIDVVNANEAVSFMVNRVDFAPPEQNQLGV